MSRGIFITFEGPEGSGKSTHIALLAAHLKEMNVRVVLTKEPGGVHALSSLRSVLLHSAVPVAPVAELLMYEADRAQHVEEVIKPALKKGTVVLCDRYTDSTLAYQGYGRKLSLPLIQTLNTIAAQGLKPDLTILLDVPSRIGLERARRRSNGHDRLEKAGRPFHERVRKGFQTLARKNPRRFHCLSAQGALPETQASIQLAVTALLKRRGLL